jgi:hypothetical protein
VPWLRLTFFIMLVWNFTFLYLPWLLYGYGNHVWEVFITIMVRFTFFIMLGQLIVSGRLIFMPKFRFFKDLRIILHAIMPLFISLLKLFTVTTQPFIILFSLDHSFSIHLIVPFMITIKAFMNFKLFLLIKLFMNFTNLKALIFEKH